jgi:excisionase family DNA binding protein
VSAVRLARRKRPIEADGLIMRNSRQNSVPRPNSALQRHDEADGPRQEPQKRKKSAMLADAKVLTVGELSDYLRVHRSTIYRLLKKGQLPGFKIGSDWRFNVEAIDEWRMHQGAAQLEELRNLGE